MCVMRSCVPLSIVMLAACAGGPARAETRIEDVRVDPPSLQLSGPHAHYTLLVHGQAADGLVDLTRMARYRSLDPKVATVTEAGIVAGVSDGPGVIQVDVAGRTLKVPVKVERTTEARRFNFENDIVPILSKFGCNSSGCHGKAE